MKPELKTLAISIAFMSLMATCAMAETNTSALPLPESQGRVIYITGGVGEDEATALKQVAATFALELQFVQKATPRDEFLADVKVTIRDRSRSVVLDTATNGPFLLANLPAGKYQVEAEYDGVSKRQAVEVRAGEHARAVFVWANRDGVGNDRLSAYESR